jgi:translation elongation factor EF-Tu-like GTPase
MTNSNSAFKIKSAFQVTGRQFFILGEILTGTIKIGMTANFSSIGIDKEFTIEAIEFALHSDDDKVWEDVGLGISGLTDAEKEILKTQTPFSTPILIIGNNTS